MKNLRPSRPRVYEPVEQLPPGHKVIQCKWIFHIKRDKTGDIICFKACLVAKGFTQIPGQDFTFTFTPVAQWDSIHSSLCLTAIEDIELCHLDVKTAFLNAPLEEELYITPLQVLVQCSGAS